MRRPQGLILDDVEERVALLTRAMRQAGLSGAAVARDGRKALALAARESFRVVVVGTRLSGMDGLTTLRHLRRSADAPVFVLAEPETAEEALDGISLGADACLCAGRDGRWSERRTVEALHATMTGRPPITWRWRGSGIGTEIGIVSLEGGRIASLLGRLRDLEPGPDAALFIRTDLPAWMIPATADRLHQMTAWRVLRAQAGDLLAPRHALIASNEDDIRLELDARRPRLVADEAVGGAWSPAECGRLT